MTYVLFLLLILMYSSIVWGEIYFPQQSDTLAVNVFANELLLNGYRDVTLQVCLQVNYDLRVIPDYLKVYIMTEEDCPTCSSDGKYTNETDFSKALFDPSSRYTNQIIMFTNRSIIEKNVYYVGTCREGMDCNHFVSKIKIISCPCYNEGYIPNPGDCNELCPSQIGYQGSLGNNYKNYTYLNDDECVKCPTLYEYPNCKGVCPSSANTNDTLFPDCNNLCENTTCTEQMKICTPGNLIKDERYQPDPDNCLSDNPKTTDKMCQNDCNGLCWYEDGWTRGKACKIRYHRGYMREDPLYHSNDVYQVPQLTYSQEYCPLGQFLSFQKNVNNWDELNYKCELCDRGTFLMHYNLPDSTSGQEHGACCQNMHHKMCGYMMNLYRKSCEETGKGASAGRCTNSLFTFDYRTNVQSWVVNTYIREILHFRVGFTYILDRYNGNGNYFANPLRIISDEDCATAGCSINPVFVDGHQVYQNWNTLPSSSVPQRYGGNSLNDAIIGKPLYWRPFKAGMYYAISTTSRYLVIPIVVTVH